jgi:DivIVA domain-containing protein
LTYPRTRVDRDQIERQDFPSARRGYDAAAVHEHLRRVADEFEALGRAAADRPAAATLAGDASERVRAILEAAETSAQQLRDEAGREAGGHVERVEQSAKRMLDKLDRLQAELDRLLDGLKSTAQTLAGSLEELSRDAGTLRGQEGAAPLESGEHEAAPEPALEQGANGARSDDEAGARLVALNMALEGTPRAETGRYLAEHYELPDPETLLDDVYTSVGK